MINVAFLAGVTAVMGNRTTADWHLVAFLGLIAAIVTCGSFPPNQSDDQRSIHRRDASGITIELRNRVIIMILFHPVSGKLVLPFSSDQPFPYALVFSCVFVLVAFSFVYWTGPSFEAIP